MAAADRHVGRLAGAQLARRHLASVILEVEQEPSAADVDRLVLRLVILERQAATRLDHDDLAAEAIRQGPDELVAPRLVDPARGERAGLAEVGHEPRTSRSPAASIDSRSSAEVASV